MASLEEKLIDKIEKRSSEEDCRYVYICQRLEELAREKIAIEVRERIRHDKLCIQLQKSGVGNVNTINDDVSESEYAQYVTYITNVTLEHCDLKILVPATAKLKQSAYILMNEVGFEYDITHCRPKDVAQYILAIDAQIEGVRESFDAFYKECQKKVLVRKMAGVALTNMLREELKGTGLGFRIDSAGVEQAFEVSIRICDNMIVRHVVVSSAFKEDLEWMVNKAKALHTMVKETSERLTFDTPRFRETFESVE